MARVLGLEAVPVLKCTELDNHDLGRCCSVDDYSGLDRVVDHHFKQPEPLLTTRKRATSVLELESYWAHST